MGDYSRRLFCFPPGLTAVYKIITQRLWINHNCLAEAQAYYWLPQHINYPFFINLGISTWPVTSRRCPDFFLLLWLLAFPSTLPSFSLSSVWLSCLMMFCLVLASVGQISFIHQPIKAAHILKDIPHKSCQVDNQD